jgi:hypothetical protein
MLKKVLEWNKSVGFGLTWGYRFQDVIVKRYNGEFAYGRSKVTTSKIMCTREEFKAYVKWVKAVKEHDQKIDEMLKNHQALHAKIDGCEFLEEQEKIELLDKLDSLNFWE